MKTLTWALAILMVTAGQVSAQEAPAGAAGTWQADVNPFPTVVLKVDGATVTGTVSTNSTAAGAAITEGSLNGNSLVVKIQFPNNGRLVTFTGTLDGDEIRFTREIAVPKGADPGGAGILGIKGPNELKVYRVIESSRFTGTARNGPTPRNPNPQPNPRPIGLSARMATSPHWRWTAVKHLEVRMFSMANATFELTSYELTSDRMQFTYKQGNNEISCRLSRESDKPYEGSCQAQGGTANLLVVLMPPEPTPASPPASAAPAPAPRN